MTTVIEFGEEYGIHRSLEPKGVIAQAAWKVDNSLPIRDSEILFEVEALNIDSASFRQIKEEAGGDPERMKRRILEIINERGKMHNPVTDSGGVFMGKVKEVGSKHPKYGKVKPGDRVVSLTSLSFTPLKIDEISSIDMEKDKVNVKGYAILFSRSPFAVIPDDLPDTVVMALLDVAGAAPQAARYTRLGDYVVVIGANGKSGLLVMHEAKKRVGPTGKVVAVIRRPEAAEIIEKAGLADEIVVADATNAMDLYRKVMDATEGRLADLTVNCVNSPNTEMASILATRDGGKVYFFSMATSFQRAALQAEGVAKNVELIIGNGYYPEHDIITLNIMKENPVLREYFVSKYS